MAERRLSYQELEDGVATLILFEGRDIVDDFYWDVEDMPDEAEPGDQYQPEFEDGELAALHYDEELTAQKRKDFKDAVERHKEMLEDN
ncbi:hypothetical protein [Halocatena marina]|uniref:DUF3006 domain-containing protein n=1 Tax=Halocatena marina TaxID=2934937 RepID=A0ABD5YWV2_9EURY|nr:hypothetical protein [Halocatena marina]